jgi:hypothetical protein
MLPQPTASSATRRVAIGIMAHDEEQRIAATLASVFAQDIFDRYPTQLHVVANGCRDATVARAEQAIAACSRFAAHAIEARDPGSSARVDRIEIAGKANAWNVFVHDLSRADAAFLLLMDADIELLQVDTLSRLVAALERDADAVVSVDQPLKDLVLDGPRTLLERLLAKATPPIDVADVPLCGQLYCGRASELRSFRLPLDLQMEDGFVRAMLLTRRFTAAEERSRIVLAAGASHRFEAVRTLHSLWRHERWVVAGSIVNMLLFAHFSQPPHQGRDAGELIAQWQAEDPHWLGRFVHAEVERRGWRLLPRHWWMRRWTRLRELPLLRRLARLPLAATAAAVDSVVFFAAIRDVRRGRAVRYWGR